jgi:hypothetical protein
MNARIALLLFLVACLLLSTAVVAEAPPGYQVQSGILSGGRYQLTSVDLQAGNVAADGVYRLLGTAATLHVGSGCCCTWLPCILRNR